MNNACLVSMTRLHRPYETVPQYSSIAPLVGNRDTVLVLGLLQVCPTSTANCIVTAVEFLT